MTNLVSESPIRELPQPDEAAQNRLSYRGLSWQRIILYWLT